MEYTNFYIVLKMILKLTKTQRISYNVFYSTSRFIKYPNTINYSSTMN